MYKDGPNDGTPHVHVHVLAHVHVYFHSTTSDIVLGLQTNRTSDAQNTRLSAVSFMTPEHKPQSTLLGSSKSHGWGDKQYFFG